MFFPILLDIKKVLVFGAGKVALRKVKLLQFYSKEIQITVISETFEPSFKNLKIKRIHEKITPDSIPKLLEEGPSLVISALNQRDLNEKIAGECHKKRIPVNVIDNAQISSVVFPAVLKEKDLVISISTLGRCPFYAREVKEDLLQYTKEHSKILEILSEIRDICIDSDLDIRDNLSLILKDKEFQNSIKEDKLKAARRRAFEIFSRNKPN